MEYVASPEEVLLKYFGYSAFRLTQRKIIETVLNLQDTLAVLPTGGGKSVCYQIPGILLGGTTIVISPLISLMKDQVEQLQKRGINACFINSTLSENEIQNIFTNFTDGKYQFVYVAPERLLTQKFVEACQKICIPLIAIDEAHCISHWGHDFRPSYVSIPSFIEKLPSRPVILAVTATATEQVREDIVRSAGLSNPKLFLSSFARENLHIEVMHCRNEPEKILWLIKLWQKYRGEKIIIYCATRAQTEHLAEIASIFGFNCSAYHAGLQAENRQEIQTEFTHNKIQMIAATNAFGMGVDIPDIRAVIHVQVPNDLEGYYQEIGRAGRDGKPSYCHLLYTDHDLQVRNTQFEKEFPDPKKISFFLNFLSKTNANFKPILSKNAFALMQKKFGSFTQQDYLHIIHVLESLEYVVSRTQNNREFLQLVSKNPDTFQTWRQQRDVLVNRRAGVADFLEKQCKSQAVLCYFGETHSTACMRCSGCLGKELLLDQESLRRIQKLSKTLENTSLRTSVSRIFPRYITQTVLAFSVLQLSKTEKSLTIPGAGRELRNEIEAASKQLFNC